MGKHFIWCVLAITIFGIGFITGTARGERRFDLIEMCEEKLPRNERCVLRAIPAAQELEKGNE